MGPHRLRLRCLLLFHSSPSHVSHRGQCRLFVEGAVHRLLRWLLRLLFFPPHLPQKRWHRWRHKSASSISCVAGQPPPSLTPSAGGVLLHHVSDESLRFLQVVDGWQPWLFIKDSKRRRKMVNKYLSNSEKYLFLDTPTFVESDELRFTTNRIEVDLIYLQLQL